MDKERKVMMIKNAGVPLLRRKFRANDLCHCGSGKKLKHCHKTTTQYYLSKKPVNNYEKVELKAED